MPFWTGRVGPRDDNGFGLNTSADRGGLPRWRSRVGLTVREGPERARRAGHSKRWSLNASNSAPAGLAGRSTARTRIRVEDSPEPFRHGSGAPPGPRRPLRDPARLDPASL